jgi:hypothetical protein
MKAIEQVENAGYWINRDALMTQTITPGTGSGFPLDLSWQDANGHTNQVTYAISGSNFQRRLAIDGVLSGQTTVASNINSNLAKTNCSYDDSTKVLNFQVTSTIGTSSQTRSYQTKTRIDQPASYLTIITSSLQPIFYSDPAVFYNHLLEAAGGLEPYQWQITSGNPPTWLSIDQATGIISGTPVEGQNFIAYDFEVCVTDVAYRTAYMQYILFINPLTITTTSLPNGKKGKDYGHNVPNYLVYLTATGGTSVYSWSIDPLTLPPGLTLDSSSGLISGIPSVKNTYPLSVTVTDNSGQTASKNLSIQIDP